MRSESLLTWGMLSLCGLLTGVNLVPRLNSGAATITQTQNTITVSVQGAVAVPGSYELPWGATAEDAVNAAGGFKSGADQALVNLAAPLDAGEALFVPETSAEDGAERVSVNSATALQLETLPRIGPAMAQRIIKARPFSSLDDLLKVKGIGPKTLEQLKPFATL